MKCSNQILVGPGSNTMERLCLQRFRQHLPGKVVATIRTTPFWTNVSVNIINPNHQPWLGMPSVVLAKCLLCWLCLWQSRCRYPFSCPVPAKREDEAKATWASFFAISLARGKRNATRTSHWKKRCFRKTAADRALPADGPPDQVAALRRLLAVVASLPAAETDQVHCDPYQFNPAPNLVVIEATARNAMESLI